MIGLTQSPCIAFGDAVFFIWSALANKFDVIFRNGLARFAR
jgi:hypothetical protein